MPDQFGNPTPQEVMAQIAGEDQALLTQGATPQERRLNRLVHATRLMAGGQDPRLAHADKIVEAQQRGLRMQPNEGESNLDFQIRQGRVMLQDMREVDPSTFAQMSEQLTALEKERLDRRLLLAKEERDVEQSAVDLEQSQLDLQRDKDELTSQSLFNNAVRFLDPNTGGLTSDVVLLTDPQAGQKIAQFEQSGLLALNKEQTMGVLDTSAGDLNVWNRSDFAEQRREVRSAARFAQSAGTLVETFANAMEDGWNPASDWATIERGLLRAGNTIVEGARALGVDVPDFGSAQHSEDIATAEAYLRNNGITSGLTASTLVAVRYATALDYNQRVTDQDYNVTATQIGVATGDPFVIANNIARMVADRFDFVDRTLQDELDRVFEASKPNSVAHVQAGILQGQRDIYSEFKDTLDANVARLNQGLPKPNATQGATIAIPGFGNLSVD